MRNARLAILSTITLVAGALGCADSSLSGGGYGSGSHGTTFPEEFSQAGQLTAGEWRDLDHWGFWRNLVDKQDDYVDLDESWGFDTAHRLPVQVGKAGDPVVDARVELIDGDGDVLWRARTDNQGRAELFDGAFGGTADEWRVRVTSGAESVTVDDVEPGWDEPLYIPFVGMDPVNVADVMFVIDTTGSMGDELAYLQVELEDVLDRASSQSGVPLRVSVNFYRDEGDAYLVHAHPFTTDIGDAIDVLNTESADGGGDQPEAVDIALQVAIQDQVWSHSARARLCFLVLDAPPHFEPEVLDRLHAMTELAADQGVRLIPVVASGMTVEGEFLLRAMDILTGGTYVFLTDDSGIGNEHLVPTVGEYDVEFLNDLLLRLIIAAAD